MKPKSMNTPANPAKLFFIGLVIVMLVTGGVLGLIGLRYGPPVGDLTRISGLSERDFGWQGETTGFAENYTDEINYKDLILGHADADVDIIVFGDSFSAPQVGNITWTNSLHALTGRSVGRVEIEALEDIKDYFQSDAFSRSPPEIVIVEMAERTVFRRARSLMDGAYCGSIPAPRPIDLKPLNIERIKWARRTNFHGFDELMSWGALSLRLQLISRHKTIHAKLNRNDLFSNKLSGHLLIYQSDVLRHKASELLPYNGTEVEQASVCALRDLLNAAEGLAQVYITVAPDKRSIYNAWITTPLERKEVNFTKVFVDALDGHYIDLYLPLLNDVLSGVRDVYFPNDTHWSGYGHARVGQIISDALAYK